METLLTLDSSYGGSYITECFKEFNDFRKLANIVELKPTIKLVTERDGSYFFSISLEGNIRKRVSYAEEWHPAMLWLIGLIKNVSANRVNQAKGRVDNLQRKLEKAEEEYKVVMEFHETNGWVDD